MPSQLPSLSPQKVVRALKQAGFVELRQKGSHLLLYNQATNRRVTIPMHKGKDIKKQLLRKILDKEAKMSVEEFLKLL